MERLSRMAKCRTPFHSWNGWPYALTFSKMQGKRGLYQSTERKGPQGSALVSAFSTKETGLVTVEIC